MAFVNEASGYPIDDEIGHYHYRYHRGYHHHRRCRCRRHHLGWIEHDHERIRHVHAIRRSS